MNAQVTNDFVIARVVKNKSTVKIVRLHDTPVVSLTDDKLASLKTVFSTYNEASSLKSKVDQYRISRPEDNLFGV